MSSKALQITDAMISLLTMPAMAGIGLGGVTIDPDYHYTTDDLPAIAVHPGDESVSDSVIGVIDRILAVKVRVLSSGSDAFYTGDALMTLAYSRVMSDLTLGGLTMDIKPQGVKRGRDVLEFPVIVHELDFFIEYRTTTTSLEI
ncbi:MAG: hypothetical protein WC710_11430 [Gallionella sp.]|jgi:hypothetical protein